MSLTKDKNGIDYSGQYFVAAELERRDFTAALPLSNTQDFDILAISRLTNKQYAIQVKTTAASILQWIMTSKHETIKGDNIIYIFVHLNELGTPDFYIIPSTILAESIRDKYSKLSAKPRKDGKPRTDSGVRTFIIRSDFEMYKNAWHILEN